MVCWRLLTCFQDMESNCNFKELDKGKAVCTGNYTGGADGRHRSARETDTNKRRAAQLLLCLTRFLIAIHDSGSLWLSGSASRLLKGLMDDGIHPPQTPAQSEGAFRADLMFWERRTISPARKMSSFKSSSRETGHL